MIEVTCVVDDEESVKAFVKVDDISNVAEATKRTKAHCERINAVIEMKNNGGELQVEETYLRIKELIEEL